MSVLEFEVFGANPAVERKPSVCESVEVSQLGRQPWGAWLPVENEYLIEQSEQRESKCEPDKGDEDPVPCQPEDDLDVSPVPAVPKMMCEEAPWVVVVLVREENAYTIVALRIRIVVVAPDDAEIERAGGSHYGDVWEGPSSVVVSQRVDGLQEEWVAGDRAHGIVRNTGGHGAAYPGGVGEERVEAAVASLLSG
mgnify:CR=1 FL=1